MIARAYFRRKPETIVTAALLVALSAVSAKAQTTCRTPDCGQNTIPAGCQNRASPRTATVLMTSALTFIPANPKIEPGDCIEWRSTAFTHNSSSDPCPDDLTSSCMSPSPPSCLWDTGNISSTGTPPAVVCHYDPVAYPSTTADGYYCRIHDNPQHTGLMHGTLRVTTAITLLLDKDTGTGSVLLSWTGGGVPGDTTYKVVRSNAGDPSFPMAGITAFDPDAGAAGTLFTDPGELGAPDIRFYLVRNRQSNE